MHIHNRQSAFTLIEMVTTILIVGILAVFAIPKFMGSSSVAPQTAQHLVLTAARRAQQLAMNKGTAANVQLTTDNTSNIARISFTDAGAQVIDYSIPSDIPISNSVYNYDVLGNATDTFGNPPPDPAISLSGANNICIETTGYARTC